MGILQPVIDALNNTTFTFAQLQDMGEDGRNRFFDACTELREINNDFPDVDMALSSIEPAKQLPKRAPKSLKCEHCGQPFIAKSGLISHMKARHGENLEQLEPAVQQTLAPPTGRVVTHSSDDPIRPAPRHRQGDD